MSETTKTTPGPWEITTANSRRYMGIKAGLVSVASVSVTNIDADANARLIAAAPDGYALAKLIVEYFGDDDIDELLNVDIRLRDAARALIAKVEGRS